VLGHAASRFRRTMRERGLLGLLVHLLRQRTPVYKSVVFRKCTDERGEDKMSGLAVVRHPDRTSLGAEVMKELEEKGGSGMVREFERLFSLGCELWLGWIGNEVTGICWSRKGIRRNDYFVTLTQDDANILSCFVFPDFRGRGIYPAMLRIINTVLMTQDNVKAVYIDCRSWNRPSIRGILKAGFVQLGTAFRIEIASRQWILCNSCRGSSTPSALS